MYIPLGPSKKDLYKIIIGLLLIVYLIFLGMYKPKAEMVNVELTSANWYVDNNNNGWKTNSPYLLQKAGWTGFKVYDFNNVNFYATANVRLFMTNGSLLANKSASFSLYLDGNYLDLVGITLLDNNSAYTCEVYSAINNETTNVYNIVCPNLPSSVNSNSFSINTYINWNGGGDTFVHSFKLGVSGINVWSNDNNTLNNINNNTQTIVNDINNSDIDSSSANDLTSNSAFQDSNGLDAIIKAPLNFIQSLTSSTCSAISLTIPYIDANVSLPCMSTIYNKALGTQLVNLIALVINGVVLYRYCLKILELVHNAKNPNKDELEVLDL